MAFQIDPSIALQVKPFDYAKTLSDVYNLRNAGLQSLNLQQEMQQRGQEMQLNQYRLSGAARDDAAAQQQQGDNRAIQDALGKFTTVDPQTGMAKVDRGKVVSELATTGHTTAGIGLSSQWAAGDMATHKAQLETAKEDLDNQAKDLGIHAQVLGAYVSNPTQQTWDQGRQYAIDHKWHGAEDIPRVPDMGMALNALHSGMTAQQQNDAAQKQIDQELDAAKLAETARQHDMEHKDRVREQGIQQQNATTDRARLNQPPKQFAFVPQPDGQTKALLVTPGMTLPQGAGTMAGITASGKAANKEQQGYQSVVDDVATAHTLATEAEKGNAPADVDLALAFFKTMKGSGGGIRFTQAEQNLIMGARSSAGDLQGVAQKVIGGGQKFTPDQRNKILRVMDIHADAARSHLTPAGAGDGGSSAQSSSPSTHLFSVSAWQKTHPGGNAQQAQQAAQQQGYQVVQ